MTCSLLGLVWLGVGTAAADPVPLKPLGGPAPSADLHDPPPLMPFMRTTLPEIPVSKPAAPEKTLYYQKDAARPATAPQPVTMPVVPMAQPAMMPANYQEPTPIQPQQGVPTLPTGAVNYTPPAIREITLLSDAELKRQITIEADRQYRQPDNIYKRFPLDFYDHPGTKVAFAPRVFGPSTMRVEPYFLCYQRLYFEDKNSERYGWELGPLQPFVSAGKFYLDLLTLPYNYGTRPCQRCECNAGYCLPGDPVPYLIYPIEASVSGALLEAGTIVGLYAILP